MRNRVNYFIDIKFYVNLFIRLKIILRIQLEYDFKCESSLYGRFYKVHPFFRLVPCLLFCVAINISIYFSNKKYLKPKEESTMGVDSWLFVFSVIDEGALLFLVVYFVSFYDIICSSMLTLLSDSDPYLTSVSSHPSTKDSHAICDLACRTSHLQ
jgi:hypothetical protein